MIPDNLKSELEFITPYVFNPMRFTNLVGSCAIQAKFTNDRYDVLVVGWNGVALTTGGTDGSGTLFNVFDDNGNNWFEKDLSITTILGDQPNSVFTIPNNTINYLKLAYPLPYGKSLTVKICPGATGTDYCEIAFWCVAFRAEGRVPVAVQGLR